ncbi:MAG: hypothetical protein Q7T18_12810, partial [Sedimentisphaerales bacterium]|nr:hypothetical protein [Sedimentisphaerales bacterium]
LERLFIESPVPMSDVLANKHALEIYTQQFILRMNNGKKYDTARIGEFFKQLMTGTEIVKATSKKLKTRNERIPGKPRSATQSLFG